MLPCIRAIVLESDELPYGHLSVITVDGGSVSCEPTDEGTLSPMLNSGSSDKVSVGSMFRKCCIRMVLDRVLFSYLLCRARKYLLPHSIQAVCNIRFNTESKRFLLEKVLTEGGEEEGELVDNTAISVILNDTVLEVS